VLTADRAHARAGNPFVTPDTTRDVVVTARLSAVNVFFDAIEKLMFELSIWRCTPEMQARPRGPLAGTAERSACPISAEAARACHQTHLCTGAPPSPAVALH